MAYSDLMLLTVDELATLRTNALAGLNAVLTSGQSYSMMGRSFTKANLSDLRSLIADINAAQAAKSGTLVRTVHADMSNG